MPCEVVHPIEVHVPWKWSRVLLAHCIHLENDGTQLARLAGANVAAVVGDILIYDERHVHTDKADSIAVVAPDKQIWRLDADEIRYRVTCGAIEVLSDGETAATVRGGVVVTDSRFVIYAGKVC